MTDHDAWYMTYEDETATDQRLVFELLCGIDVRCPPNKRFRKIYPTGDRELSARAALARLLRKGDPFPPRIREALAALFDPTNTDGRRVEFKPGRRSSSQEITALIAAHVWAQLKMGDPKEAAVAKAMEEFRLKRRRVFEICHAHEGDFPGLASALK
jgi:hypothetical protein